MVDKNLQDFELAALDEWVELAKLVNEEASKNETKNDQYMLSNKCNQCDYTSSCASNLRRYLKTHSGGKLNKCSQCDFACSDPSSLKRHMERHRPVKKVTVCRKSLHKSIANFDSKNSNQ